MDDVREIMEVKQNMVTTSTTEIVSNKQMQEIQAAMTIAKKFPRDEIDACNRIRKSCQRKSLAEKAEYSYPRGGKRVTGASIRLAESVAQHWGNIDYGLVELSRNYGSSEMMAYAWDLETNTRRTQVFTVQHIREKKGGNTKLTDPRDIYEMTSNLGARRVRACILAVIPGDVVEDAVNTCHETLKGSHKDPLIDRAKKMVAVFDDEFSVKKEMIEEYFGYNLEALSEIDYAELISIYNSLKDGMSKRSDWFKMFKKEKSGANPVSSIDNNESGEEKKGDKK